MADTQFDIDSYNVVTTALLELLNDYPLLQHGDEIKFSTLSEDGGIAMFPVSGAVIQTERTDIVGNVTQTCLYPFYLYYRASGLSASRKAAVKEWLDSFGRWLERQPITDGATTYQLESYPALTDGREFTSIARQTPAFKDDTNESQSEDWVIYISAQYQRHFKR